MNELKEADVKLVDKLSRDVIDLLNDNIPDMCTSEGVVKTGYVLASALGCVLAPCIVFSGEKNFNQLLPQIVDIVRRYAISTAKEVNDLVIKNTNRTIPTTGDKP